MSRAIFIVATLVIVELFGGEEPTFPTPVEAMRKAVERLPAVEEGTPSAGRLRNYREALKAGEPLVIGTPTMRPTTVLFAFEMSEANRNEWLRQCLRFMTEAGFKKRYLAMGQRHRVTLGVFSVDGGLASLEAVYNLSTEATTKAHARAVHVDRATEWHDHALKEWEEGKVRGGGNTSAPRPVFPRLGMWDLEKLRGKAAVMGP